MTPLEKRATRSFWLWGFLFLFLLQSFAIFWLGDRPMAAPVVQNPPPFLHLPADPAVEQRLMQSLPMRDPTLFALPSRHGFSGGAWLDFSPNIPQLSNSPAPPDWLSLPTDQLGAALADYAVTNRPAADELLASLRAIRRPDVRIPDEPVLTNTHVRLEGTLAERPVLSRPALPSAVHSELLRRTVVSVLVNGDGIVESAAVVIESGSREADRQALETVRQFVFAPLPIEDAEERLLSPPMPGRLVFIWHVTNAAPLAAVGNP